MRWAALLVAAAVAAGCGGKATGSPPPLGATTAGAPIVLQGHGDSQTDSFYASGAYRLSLTAKAWGTYPCIPPTEGVTVQNTDPAVSYTSGSFGVGTSNLPPMPPGNYYVRAHLEGCAWTVTLTPP